MAATEFNENTHAAQRLASKVSRSRCPHASGKSNALAGLRYMRKAVAESFAEWSKGVGVPREPFALDPQAREETSFFEVELLLGQTPVRYTYGFEISDDRGESEWLHAYPAGRRQVWFDRDASRADDSGEEFQFRGSGLRGRKEEYASFTRPNALFLSVAAAMNHPQLIAVHRWFLDNLWLVTSGRDVAARTLWTRERVVPDEGLRARLTSLLTRADLGISEVTTDAESGEVRLLHRAADGSSLPLDFWEQESLGTHAWFAFLGPLLHVLQHGGVLLADELDSSLHPLLAAEVVRLFQDREANPLPAQLIFTTHDATLLGPSVAERPLDREQVWITLKSASGETELYPLTAARKARNDENLERRYLHGHYGGVPVSERGIWPGRRRCWKQELRATA